MGIYCMGVYSTSQGYAATYRLARTAFKSLTAYMDRHCVLEM